VGSGMWEHEEMAEVNRCQMLEIVQNVTVAAVVFMLILPAKTSRSVCGIRQNSGHHVRGWLKQNDNRCKENRRLCEVV